MKRYLVVLASVLLLVAAGCADGKPTAIRGTVTLDGQPLERGRIEFRPLDETGPIAAAEIVDGNYEGLAMAGKKTVVITGGKVVGRRPFTEAPGSPMIEDVQPLVGAEYNDNSKLTCDITPIQTQYDFALESPVR
ncbi:MAG TPA: hypothetical protein DD670_09670 [Planctomycetaceae bacterium]|nr:hypothetical protein [Planctomycetaceae bacterium]